MKSILRKALSPILNIFEKGEGVYGYKPSNRLILNVVGLLFLLLASGIIFTLFQSSSLDYFLPGAVFLAVGLVCLTVGLLGTDRAVAKIWGNEQD